MPCYWAKPVGQTRPPVACLMRDTKAIGDISEGMVLAELLKAGKRVLLPFGERHKYDLVIDDGGTFTRVQCKTGRLRRDTIIFSTSSVVRDSQTKKHTKRYYTRDEIDMYGVYCPENHRVYLVPVDDVAKTEGRLRVGPSERNTGRQGSTYLLDHHGAVAERLMAPGC